MKAGITKPPTQPFVRRFWCREYPFFDLYVPGVGRVRFQNGRLETRDPRVIAALRTHDWYGGIIQEGEPPPLPPAPPAKPARTTFPAVARVIPEWDRLGWPG